MVPNPYDTRQRVKSMFGLAPTLGAQAGRGQAYREALAYITRAALMGAATGISPGSGTVSQKCESEFVKRRTKLRMELQAYLLLVLPDSPRAGDRLSG